MKSPSNSSHPVRFEKNQVQPRMMRMNTNQEASKKSSSYFSIHMDSPDSQFKFRNNIFKNNLTRPEIFSKMLLVRGKRAVCESMAYIEKTGVRAKSPRLWIFEGSCVGQASRLTSNDLRPQARRPRYIPEAQISEKTARQGSLMV